jgi:hypothetical protein
MTTESRRDEGSATQPQEERSPASDGEVQTHTARRGRSSPPHRVNSIRPSRPRDRSKEGERSASAPEGIAADGKLLTSSLITTREDRRRV